MDDLARLLIARVVVFGSLQRCESTKTPAASWGKNGSTESAVMMLSRPNNVANHGIPAMIESPRSVTVVSAARSLSDLAMRELVI